MRPSSKPSVMARVSNTYLLNCASPVIYRRPLWNGGPHKEGEIRRERASQDRKMEVLQIHGPVCELLA